MMSASIDGKPLPEREVSRSDAAIFKQSWQTKSSLDEDFVTTRNEKRVENRARHEELAKNLAERNRLLTTKTREQLAGLSDRDQLMFWCVRDATVHDGINGIDIPSVRVQLQSIAP